MKNPKSFSNSELIEQLKSLAGEERRLGLEILHFLREVEKRRLYADRYSSLHEFAVKELHYSDGAAYRRIQSMRLLKDLPEVEEEIKSGTLTLSTASLLQSFFKHEEKKKTPYSVTQKKELLQVIKGKSARQTEALLAEKAPEIKNQEKERAIAGQKTQVTLVLSHELSQKLEKLKNLLAHKNPNPSYAELIEMLADVTLKKLDPAQEPERKTERASTSKPHTYRPSAQNRRLVWQKAEGQCEHRDSQTGTRCNSSYALQVDHKTPYAKSGTSELTNLQLLCAVHNRAKSGVRILNQIHSFNVGALVALSSSLGPAPTELESRWRDQ